MYDLTDFVIWLGATLSAWVVASEIITTFVEKVKPVYQNLLNIIELVFRSVLGTETSFSIKPIRAPLIVLFVYIASYMAVTETNYNMFEGAPLWLQGLAENYVVYINAAWLAFGAFFFHRINDALSQKFVN